VALLAVQDEVVLGDAPPVFVAAGALPGGDTWPNRTPEPELWAEVTETLAYTVVTKNDCGFGSHPNWTGTIEPGGPVRLGVFPAERYTDGTGLAQITFADPTEASVAVVRPRPERLTND
jgi:hypothetical protein